MLDCAEEVVGQCKIRQASGEAPHLVAAGTSMVSAPNDNAQVGPLFAGDAIVPYVMDLYSKYSPLVLGFLRESSGSSWRLCGIADLGFSAPEGTSDRRGRRKGR